MDPPKNAPKSYDEWERRDARHSTQLEVFRLISVEKKKGKGLGFHIIDEHGRKIHFQLMGGDAFTDIAVTNGFINAAEREELQVRAYLTEEMKNAKVAALQEQPLAGEKKDKKPVVQKLVFSGEVHPKSTIAYLTCKQKLGNSDILKVLMQLIKPSIKNEDKILETMKMPLGFTALLCESDLRALEQIEATECLQKLEDYKKALLLIENQMREDFTLQRSERGESKLIVTRADENDVEALTMDDLQKVYNDAQHHLYKEYTTNWHKNKKQKTCQEDEEIEEVSSSDEEIEDDKDDDYEASSDEEDLNKEEASSDEEEEEASSDEEEE